MPSLMAILGLDGSKFRKGLEDAKKEADKAGEKLNTGLIGKIKGSGLFKAIASPIGAASTVAAGFIGMIIAKVDELQERAKDIKLGAEKTNLSTQQFQPLFFASQAVGADPEAAGKGITKIAEAQDKIKTGASGAAEALTHFSALGITLREIQSMGPQEIFLKIAESMHVSKLSAEQMAAGSELLGKSFEALEPVFKRGFNDPVDQMKMLSDEEIQRLNKMSHSTAILKETWNTALASIANAAVGIFGRKGVDPDEEVQANEKRLQELLNKQQAAKAAAQNTQHQNDLKDAQAKKKNDAKAAELQKQAREEERQAKLRAMTAGERLAALKKETAELEAQKSALVEKLKTEKDAADAPKIAELALQIAKNKNQEAEINRSSHPELQLTELQKQASAAFQESAATNHLQSTAQNTAQTVQRLDQLIAVFNAKFGMAARPGENPFANVKF